MGASRKLQGEIDRVLKKVNEGVDEFDTIWNKVHDTDNANLKEKFEADLKKEIKKLQRHRDQIKTWQQSSEIKDKKALMDARKHIEREMERFKVFEKETKTKAFSKEGLGQLPKTDPREKAKSETRDWLNNVVGDLENQIDNFEADLEGISVKKGKTRNTQLTHLETSIARHKAHVMKLELILRLLDNDELSPDEVNDIKEFLFEYVECNQVNFENYDDVDDLYATLPLDKVEALEDLVTPGTSGLVKAALLSPTQPNVDQDKCDEIPSPDSNSVIVLKTSSAKAGAAGPSVSPTMSSSVSPILGSAIMEEPNSDPTSGTLSHTSPSGPTLPAVLSDQVTDRVLEESTVPASSTQISSNSVKEDINLPECRPSPTSGEIPLEKAISREIPYQERHTVPMSITSVGVITSNVSVGSVPLLSDKAKINVSSIDERLVGGTSTPPLSSPLSSRILLQQASKLNDDTIFNDNHSFSDGSAISGRGFPIGTSEWRSQSATAFKNPNEGQIRGRPEIAPDQREKYLQRLQQVQQQGHSSLLSVPHLPATNHKQFNMQQESSILQQFNAQTMTPRVGLGLNIQPPPLNSVTSSQLQNSIHQLPSQNLLMPAGVKDVGEESQQQQPQNLYDDMNGESSINAGLSKITNDDKFSSPPTVAGSAMLTEGNQFSSESGFLLAQPLQHSISSSSLGVIGRCVPDRCASVDNICGSTENSGGLYDPTHNLQLLEAAHHQLPQPKDSDHVKSYIPRHPAVTPASFPQTQSDIVKNPAFWNRLGADDLGADTLFCAFYHQQNTYQQYLAARELKKQSWRYHKQYNTWFQRHLEPEVTTDDYEKGTYVYFDYHISHGAPQNGWCQRIKANFTFEYKYLEDDLVT